MKALDKNGNTVEIFRSLDKDRLPILMIGTDIIARAGSNGSEFIGWHSHHGPVQGDWATTDDVIAAYDLARV